MSLLHLSSAASQAGPEENTAIDTTLYELIEAIIDTIELNEDALIGATVQDLIESGKLRWVQGGRQLAATRHVTSAPFLNRN